MKKLVCTLIIAAFIGRAIAQTTLPIAAISASSGQKNSGTTPTMALDGKMDTRWSSEFTDNEWLQIDFNSPVELVGLTIHWETAYGRDYEIELLNAEGKWYSVSQVHFGDGGIDEIYFGPKKTMGIRLVGHKRGTGWGYSIWDIGTLGVENEIFAKASCGTDANAVLDSNDKTVWTAGQTDANATLEIIFPKKFDVGGLQINWASTHSPACKIQMLAQKDGKWETITNKKAGQSKTEDLFFKPVSAEKLRFVFDGGNSEPVRIADIQIKGTSEGWTPVRHFEMLAQRLPDGLLPNWLSRKQAFWTITGLPGSFNESLLEEYGKIESGLRDFSITPALVVDGKLLSAKNFETSQSLAEGWIPIPNVKWLGNGLEMNITANTIEPDTTLVLYKLSNTSDKTRDISLLLAARPLQVNPPWQHGGYSQIKQAKWQSETNTLTLNNREALRLCSAPSFVSLYSQKATADSIDVVECLLENRTDGQTLSSDDGIISAGLRCDYKLKAGETKSILAIYPNKEGANITAPEDGEKFFREETAKSIKLWKEKIDNWSIDIPDKKLVNLIRSNLAYLLINADGPATQPGSRNYNSSWIRDGVISATAMMRFGLVDNGTTYLKWFTGLIKDDGFVPFLVATKTGEMEGFAGNWQEYDSFGEYVFLVRQAVELTDDDEIAKLCWPKIKAVMKYMENLRNQRLTEKYKGTEYEGILPESVSHEGYIDPPRHSYWDDFFALKGLQDAQAIASRLGHTEDAAWLAKFETDMRKSVLQSIERVCKIHNIETIPGCAELGDFDPTSTSIGIMVADERDTLPANRLKATYDKYMEESRFRASQPVGTRSTYTPYEVRNISAALRLGRIADAQMLLDFFVEDGVRPFGWNHMGEVVHGDLRTPSYIGDMPHTWVGAGLINAIRDMFVYEDRGRLVLAAGVPDSWLAQGVTVRNLQTWWGPISYTLKRDKNGQAILKLKCSQQPPNGFVVPDNVKLLYSTKTNGLTKDDIEILKNPSFEEGIVGWQKKGNAAHIERYQWHTYEGKSSYGINNDGGAENAYGEIFQEIRVPGEIKKGDLFIFKAWMKSEDRYSGKANLKLEFLDANGKLLKSCESEILSGRFKWTKVAVGGKAPEGTKKVIVKCISKDMAEGKGLSYVWFDDAGFDCPVITTSSVLADTFAAKNVMKEGLWRSDHFDNQWLMINHRYIKKFTGLFIDWDKDYAKDYDILISDDGEKWNSVYKARKDKQGLDKVYLNETSAKFMKIVCGKSSTGDGFGIKNIEITGPTGLVTLEKYYEIMAEQSPAYYPRWLSKKQAYWNTIGVEGDDNEAIICEDGTIEPHKRGFSVIPFMYLDGKLITREDAKVTQSLEKDYLPIPSVKWNYDDVEMDVKLFVYGKRNESIAYVSYTVENKSKDDASGKLFLTIRPLQIFPPWQNGGGFSPVNKVEYLNSVIKVNNKFKIFPLVKPDAFGSIAGSECFKLPFKSPAPQGSENGILAYVKKGIVPKQENVEDAAGFASSALAYDFELKPGESKEFFVAIPLHDKMPSLNSAMDKEAIKTGFEKILKENIAYWEYRVNRFEIDIPEQDIVNTLKSYIAYNLITKDGPALQPGARSYEKSWIRDGGMAATALLKMGITSEVKEFIDWFTTFQYENGLVPPIIDTKAEDPLWEEKPPHNLIEYDSQGEYVYTIFEYYRFTGDKDFLKGKLINVKKALEYLVYLRSQTLRPEFKDGHAEKRKYYGILPPSTSHEGYGCEYSYWDDFWALKGWKDGRDIFTILGEDELAKWADKEYNDFKKCFYDSIKATIEFYKIDYLPASASLGDFDPTSTAVAIMYCDELVNLQTPELAPALKFTFDKYYKDLSSRFEPDAKYRFTPYELRTTPALFYMGEKEKGLSLLRFMLKCRRPLKWNELAEVVNSDYRYPDYFGDMPHTWVGAEYINSVRSLFVYETGDQLILGHGIDGKWLERKEGISVKNMATYYGNISYTMRKDGDTVIVKISGTAKPDNGFVFKSPFLNKKIKSATIDGTAWKDFTESEVIFNKLPAEIELLGIWRR